MIMPLLTDVSERFHFPLVSLGPGMESLSFLVEAIQFYPFSSLPKILAIYPLTSSVTWMSTHSLLCATQCLSSFYTSFVKFYLQDFKSEFIV